MTGRATEMAARRSERARRLDAKISRCAYCGEWRWDRDDCSVCLEPAVLPVERRAS